MIKDFNGKLTIDMSKITHVGDVNKNLDMYDINFVSGRVISLHNIHSDTGVYVKRENFIRLWIESEKKYGDNES